MSKILVVGSFVMDNVAEMDSFPDAGETVLGKSLHLYPGGKGINQCIAAARLGGDVEMAGMLGKDSNSEVFREVLKEEGSLGVLVCGSGIGMSIAANRHKGIRAALCNEPYGAMMARAHNDANVLCLGVGDGLVTKTLGGNIMEMLSNSFFMKNSIGDVIKEEIASIVDMYNKVVREDIDVREDYRHNLVRFRYICKNIGDAFYKNMLTNMVDDMSKAVKKN